MLAGPARPAKPKKVVLCTILSRKRAPRRINKPTLLAIFFRKIYFDNPDRTYGDPPRARWHRECLRGTLQRIRYASG